MSKIQIKKGDTVYVLAGEDKGKTGRVLAVLRDKNRAIVEGVNIVTKATKPSAQYPQGGLIKKEAPIHISNINLVDPKSGKPTRIAIKRENGKVVRIAKKSNQEIK
ncbi:MAG: 50S ribosomal protein L24 [Muribaculaceae bacterium]|nr:50S ribosomal protein L24 [Muribaculaceae bacterium]MDE6527004.1 50S ribosomal protein L24 [Muribaculaceae bacterium]MDE6611256.1 50S ribosomal protein L24 [Muribaculaceae bacterium]